MVVLSLAQQRLLTLYISIHAAKSWRQAELCIVMSEDVESVHYLLWNREC